jgi:hypothetical protein
MHGWMGIGEFLHEVDRLARMQSAHLQHAASPPAHASPDGHLPTGGLGPFTTRLLHAARGDAFEAPNSPAVQILEAKRNRSSTRWQFTTQPLHSATTWDVDNDPVDSPRGGVREQQPDAPSTGLQPWAERPQAA